MSKKKSGALIRLISTEGTGTFYVAKSNTKKNTHAEKI